MEFPASSLLRLMRFPLSRYMFMFRQVRDQARALDVPAVVALAELGFARAKAAMELDHLQRTQRPSRFPPEARELDQLVDAAVTGLDSYCEAQSALFRGEERAAAAARIRQKLLPRGVGYITQRPYAEQHGEVDALLRRAEEPEALADLAVLPGMDDVLTRIRDVNTRYGALLHQSQGALTRQDVRARHDECQELLCTLACLIIGHLGPQPERHADRDHLLGLILRQDKALRERRRRRRASSNASDTPDEIVAEPDDEI
jgi:hypothetical protein